MLSKNKTIVYPIMENNPELVKTSSGRSISDVTLKNILEGTIKSEELKIHKDTLLLQAKIAEDKGEHQIAANLIRAAELSAIPDDYILKVYNCIRPKRATEDEILYLARELEEKFNAKSTANFIKEAAQALKESNCLREHEK